MSASARRVDMTSLDRTERVHATSPSRAEVHGDCIGIVVGAEDASACPRGMRFIE